MERLRQLIHEIRRRPLWQVLGIYVVASGAVLVGVGALLPEWFLPLAFILLIVGLPLVLARASEPREMGCLIRLLVIDGIVRIAFGGIGVYTGIFFYIEERRLVDPGAGWIHLDLAIRSIVQGRFPPQASIPVSPTRAPEKHQDVHQSRLGRTGLEVLGPGDQTPTSDPVDAAPRQRRV